MYTLIVENEKGKQLRLTQTRDYVVNDISGLTPADALISSSPLANFDGEIYNSSRVKPRNLVITIYPQFPIEENRIKLYEFLKPSKWVKVYYKNGTRNVFIEGYVETMNGNLFELNQSIQVSILCLQPFFKSLNELISDVSKLKPLFTFPFNIEKTGIPFSEWREFSIGELVNNGDIDTGIIIEINITGNVSNPKIYNADTNEYIGINYPSFMYGDKIVIDTNVGNKSVIVYRNNEKHNYFINLDVKSKWLKAKSGVNFFTYTADSGLEYMSVKFRMHELFEGV